jgi:hypothetical protein
MTTTRKFSTYVRKKTSKCQIESSWLYSIWGNGKNVKINIATKTTGFAKTLNAQVR